MYVSSPLKAPGYDTGAMSAYAILAIELARDGETSCVRTLRSDGPLVLRPCNPKAREPLTRHRRDVARIALAAGTAGPLGGDQYSLNVHVGAGSTLVMAEVAHMLVGYVLQWLFDRVRFQLYCYMPARTANVAGFLLTVFLVVIVTRNGVLDRLIADLDDSVTIAQELFDTAPPAPTSENITGGKGSLVNWEALGQPGRNYVTRGLDTAHISAFTGRDAIQPIRIYVGRAQGDTAQQRADIALAELKRQGGFDRDVLIVALPTGSGWLDPGAVDTVEFMHGGNIATIAVQYSYLQSPLALILETRSA